MDRKLSLIVEAFDILQNQQNKEIVVIQELTETIKNLALNEWEFSAKENLSELGFTTDKDIYEYLKDQEWAVEFDDPNPDAKDYYGVNIIPDNIDYSIIVEARKRIKV